MALHINRFWDFVLHSKVHRSTLTAHLIYPTLNMINKKNIILKTILLFKYSDSIAYLSHSVTVMNTDD